jgi:Protein of unknown function (DUF2950)
MNMNKLNRLLAAVLLGSVLVLPAPAVLAAGQQSFATPEAAMEAFGAAVLDSDEAALRAMFGDDFRQYFPPAGAELRYQFFENWAKSHKIDPAGERRARIAVGEKGWTLPIPLEKTASGWRFDMKAGRDEIAVRAIGRNELAAIQVAKAYVEAQKEYFAQDRNGDGVAEYAQKIRSSPDKKDGLYWPDKAGEAASPLGRLLADAAAEKGRKPGSYHGYSYRILTAQGAAAPGGARNYVVDGRLTGGFGLLLWPASYGRSGVMSFMINQDGVVYEKNLGPATAKQAARLQSFNPDATWRKVDDNP